MVGEVGDGKGSQLTAIGDTVNTASRLESAAEAGGICISGALHALVEGLVEAEYLGERTLKGKSEPQRVYRLDGLKAGTSRFEVARRRGLTGLVERDAELEVLRQCLAYPRQPHRAIRGVVAGRGRPSVSELIVEIAERHISEVEG